MSSIWLKTAVILALLAVVLYLLNIFVGKVGFNANNLPGQEFGNATITTEKKDTVIYRDNFIYTDTGKTVKVPVYIKKLIVDSSAITLLNNKIDSMQVLLERSGAEKIANREIITPNDTFRIEHNCTRNLFAFEQFSVPDTIPITERTIVITIPGPLEWHNKWYNTGTIGFFGGLLTAIGVQWATAK